ncbi:alpha/beta fold hydrolase [Rhodovibrionaceae bacterium A322]
MALELMVDGKKAVATTGGRPFNPADPVVVFVHGSGMDHTVWALQSRYLAHHGRSVLAVDLPGHGRSDGDALTSIEEIADWLVRLLDAAGVEQAAMVGHSMGAIAVLEAAVRHPARVRALALCGVAQAMPVHPAMLASAEKNEQGAIDMVNGWGHGGKAHRGGHMLSGAWMVGGGNRLLQRSRPGSLYADLKACNDWQGGEAAAEKVTCPTLVLMGSADKMTPARAGSKLAAAITGAKPVVLPGIGHMMMSEAPDATLAALKEVL